MSEENISELQFELIVNGEQWKRVERLDCYGSYDQVYYLDRENGEIAFGDGEHGQRPPVGASIQASYRCGAGTDGTVDNGLTISLTWISGSFRKNEVIGVIIKPKVDGIIFRICRESKVSHRWKWMTILCRNIKRLARRLRGQKQL